MNAPFQQPGGMNADEFTAWAMAQDTGRYELFAGEIVGMAPERIAHNELKLDVAVRLRNAIQEARLECQVLTDGMAVRVDDETVFEPDVSVRCGPRLDANAVEIPDP